MIVYQEILYDAGLFEELILKSRLIERCFDSRSDDLLHAFLGWMRVKK
jgi:hypothetical protein